MFPNKQFPPTTYAPQTLCPDANSDSTPDYKDTILTFAARTVPNAEMFQKFFDLAPEMINLQNGFGSTPLFVAVHKRKFDIARFLLSKGTADIRVRNINDNTIFETLRWRIENVPEDADECRQLVADIFGMYGYVFSSETASYYREMMPANIKKKHEILMLINELQKLAASL